MNPTASSSLPAECRQVMAALDCGQSISAEHINTCATCAREMEARTLMNRRLRLAHESIAPPFGMETRIRAALAEDAAPAARGGRGVSLWIAAAAMLICLISGGIAYQLGHLRWTTDSQNSYIASLANSVATLLRPGLKDHVHCAVYRKHPKAAPTASQLEHELGTEYRELLTVVSQHAPRGYRTVIAHRCRYQGRQYVHLALRGSGGLVSLVIARKGEGESFTTEQLRPVLVSGGTPFYQAQAQRFSISAFETADYLVYTVSEFPPEQNTKLMASMAPQVQAVLAQSRL